MTTLLNMFWSAYWFTFLLGTGFLVISAALGAFGMADGGADADVDFDADLDTDFDFDGDFDADMDVDAGGDFDADFDADIDTDFDGGFDSSDLDFDADLDGDFADHADISHGPETAGHETSGVDTRIYKWYSPVSISSFLSGFGGAGLLALKGSMPWIASLPIALLGGAAVAFILWVVIGRLMMSAQAREISSVSSLRGQTATVITPLDEGSTGEISYTMDGTRYTAPARLVGEGRIAKHEKVRIRRFRDNVVYVSPKRKLAE